jgi:hypothetical protein
MDNQDERLLSRRAQARRYGVVLKTIERWGKDPELGFPDEIEINGRFFRELSKLEAFERSKIVIAAKRAAPNAQSRSRSGRL